MQKKLYRTIDQLLDHIDHSGGNEQALVEILHALVESPDMTARGVVSGRLYREREQDYELIVSLGERGPSIRQAAGMTILPLARTMPRSLAAPYAWAPQGAMEIGAVHVLPSSLETRK